MALACSAGRVAAEALPVLSLHYQSWVDVAEGCYCRRATPSLAWHTPSTVARPRNTYYKYGTRKCRVSHEMAETRCAQVPEAKSSQQGPGLLSDSP